MKVGDCPRCGAPRGMIGWLCGHTGEEQHDRKSDAFWEDWNERMHSKEKPKPKE